MTEEANLARHQAITAQAWSGMLAVLLAMLIADVVRLSMKGNFDDLVASLNADPGPTGLWVLICLICLNTLVQVAVRTVDAPVFRRAVFWLTVAYTVFFVIHQVVHLLSGEGFSIHTILDLTHHTLGVWACWAAYQWAWKARR